MAHVKTMEAVKIVEDIDTTATNPFTAVEEEEAHKTAGIGAEDMIVDLAVILHITVGHTEFLPIRVKTALPHKMSTKRTRYGVTIFREVIETAPDSSGQ